MPFLTITPAEIWPFDPDGDARQTLISHYSDIRRRVCQPSPRLLVAPMAAALPEPHATVVKPEVIDEREEAEPINGDQLNMPAIVSAMAAEFNLFPRVILSRPWPRSATYARMACAYVAYKYTQSSYHAIARRLHYADHTSVIHAVSQISNQLVARGWLADRVAAGIAALGLPPTPPSIKPKHVGSAL